MTFRELLIDRQAGLCRRWLDAVLADYGEVTAVRWRRERDPFANPVGHALATGLPEIFRSVAEEGDPSDAARKALEAIVRIRSVQELTPSRAAGFVLPLREVIRSELAAELAGGAHDEALAAIDRRIERLTFLAFDLYVRIREQVFRLRQEELKRSVASLLRRWHGGGLPEPASDVVQLSPLRTPASGGDV